VAEVRVNTERLRRDGYRGIVEHLADRFGLRAGLTVDDATHLLLMFGSGTPYLTLTGYGWSHERYVDWLSDSLAVQLLARPGRPVSRASDAG